MVWGLKRSGLNRIPYSALYWARAAILHWPQAGTYLGRQESRFEAWKQNLMRAMQGKDGSPTLTASRNFLNLYICI